LTLQCSSPAPWCLRRHNAIVFGGFYAILNLAFPFSPSFPMMGARAQQLRRHRAPRSLRVPGPPNDPSAPLQGCAPRCVDGEQRSRVAAPSRPCTARSLPSCRALHCAILLQKPSRAPQGGAGGVTLPGLPLPPPPPHTHTHTHTHTRTSAVSASTLLTSREQRIAGLGGHLGVRGRQAQGDGHVQAVEGGQELARGDRRRHRAMRSRDERGEH
jgi:hypothetical protein